MYCECMFMFAQKPFGAQGAQAGDFKDHNPS